jgi:uncharacterized protein YciI
MLYVIHALDRPGALPVRLRHYDAHKAYLADTAKAGVRIVMSGPLVAEDGETAIGSLLVVEAETLTDVEAFNRADPFHAAGIWDKVTITAFLKRQDNRG